MHGPETLLRLNSEHPPRPHPLRMHPRIVGLRQQIRALPVDKAYASRLLVSLYKYADQIVERPCYLRGEGWNDLEALQQVTLGDMMEEKLMQYVSIIREER
jgi:hypothetical protein